MLQRIRGGIRGKGAYIILALLALPLAILGFDWFQLDVEGAIAEVNGEEIGNKEFSRQLTVERQRVLAEMYGGEGSLEIDEQALANRVLRQLVYQRILLQQVETLGLQVSLDAIDQEILAQGEFREDGFFSPQLYQSVLRERGYTPGYYKDTVRNDLLVQQLLSPMRDSEFTLPYELDRMRRIYNQERSVEYVEMPAAAWLDQVSASDEEVQEYYDQRPGLFLTEMQVFVSYFFIERQEFYEDVPEEELRAYYEEEIVALSEQLYAAHILLETGPGLRSDEQARSELLAIKRQLEEGADFAEMARRYSDDIGSAGAGGDLGISDGESFPEAFEQGLSRLAPGATSEPVQTEAGWHLIRRLEVPLPPYEQRREAILEAVRRILSEPPYQEFLEEVAAMLTTQFSLVSFTRPRGYELYQSQFSLEEPEGVLARPLVMEVTAKHADSLMERIEESEEAEQERQRRLTILGRQDEIDAENNAIERDQVFSLGASELVRLDEDTAMVMRILWLHPPHEQTAEESWQEITDIIKQQRAEELADSEVQRMFEEVRRAELSLEEVARAGGYQHHAALALRRRDADENFPAEVLNHAFRMPPPEPGRLSVELLPLPQARFAIIQVLEINEEEEEEYGEARRALADQISNDRGGLLAAIYQFFLNSIAEIEVN